VLGANGSLVGYSAGVKTKEFLLKLEGALMI
jgi:O6-methylguanine-DNA--protein-cysteine methyltransferase